VILTKDSSSGKEAIESLIGMLGDEPQKSSAKVDDLLLSLIKNNQVRVIHQKMHEQRICKLTISAEATEIDIKRAVNNVLRMSPDSVVFNVDTKITPQMLNICKHSVKEMESTGFDAEIKFIDDVSITNGATSIGMYSGGS
jgi:predicted component of type VI protein secretion system